MTLLSGRSCSQIFNVAESVQDVLEQSARLLGLDPDVVVRSGSLVSGTSVIKNLREDLPYLKIGLQQVERLHVVFDSLHETYLERVGGVCET